MKILMLSDVSTPHTIRWANALKENGVDIEIFSLFSLDGNASKLYPGIPIISAEFEKILKSHKSRMKKILYLTAVKKINETIMNFKPDVVHGHYITSYGLLGVLTKFKPFAISIWGSEIIHNPDTIWLDDLVVKYVLKRSTHTFVSSYYLKKKLNNYGNYPSTVLPFGFNPNFINSAEKYPSNLSFINKTVIGIVKRLEDETGIDILIRAFGLLRQQISNAQLLIIGDGSRENNLKKLAKDMGLGDSVIFTGKLQESEVSAYYQKMNLAVFPSRRESFGVSQLEALAHGLPVISTNLGGIPEIISHNETGILIEENNPESLSSSMVSLLQNKDKLKKISTKGKEFAFKNFSIDVLTHRLIETYENLIFISREQS